jgi:hypothetical protein
MHQRTQHSNQEHKPEVAEKEFTTILADEADILSGTQFPFRLTLPPHMPQMS